MTKNLKSLIIIGLIASFTTLISCNKNKGGEDKEPEAGAENIVIDASEYESWSYLNLADSKTNKLDIQSKEGAVTGLYTGTAVYNLYGMSGTQKDLNIVISQLNQDSVKIEIYGINVSMSEEETLVNLTSTSKAVKDQNKWTLSTSESTSNFVDPDGSGTTKNYKLKVNGEIGVTTGGEVNLTLSITPGAMPMEIPYQYTSKVENSYIYQVEGEDGFEWDVAFHKYDIRTNGATVAQVTATSLEDVTEIPNPNEFSADIEGAVMCDLSNMTSGAVGFHHTTINPVLYNWVNRTETGAMPPTLYELKQGVVFIIKTKDNKYYKMKFTDHTNDLAEATYPKIYYMQIKE